MLRKQKILVWDAPVRVFHWLMVLSFAGAYLTAESERWRLLHVTLGYTMAGLVLFRIFWGLIGTRYARFSSFVHGPKAVMQYLKALLQGHPEHYVGHNPAGAIVIMCMIGLSLVVAATGFATYQELGSEWLEELHEGAANIMLALVGVHIAGVLVSGKLHHENLVGPMITGYKIGAPDEGIRRAWRGVAAIMLAAVFAGWMLQWKNAPSYARDSHSSISKEVQHQQGQDSLIARNEYSRVLNSEGTINAGSHRRHAKEDD